MSACRQAPGAPPAPVSHAQRLQASLRSVPPTSVAVEEKQRLYALKDAGKAPLRKAGESPAMYEVRMVIRRLEALYDKGDNGPARFAAALTHYIDAQDSLTLLQSGGELLDKVAAAFRRERVRRAEYEAREAALNQQLRLAQAAYDYNSALSDMLIPGGGKFNQASAKMRDPALATEASDRLEELKAEKKRLQAAEAVYRFEGRNIFP